ncbi:MAG: Hsp33 family molecular chaperone HslO [Woeseiaceae bacterium]|nr:Hsp33 family molecular chaperone HslO [Woeseiaceae bacterium]
MITPVQQDVLIPFAFEKLPVRGAVVQLGSAWQELLSCHDYPPSVRQVLGHAAAAVPLIVATLKDGSSVTLQITGDGPLSMLVMQCDSKLRFRGLANASEIAGDLPFETMAAGARCAITIDHERSERPYQGIVDVNESTLAASLENYFRRSAQLPSHLALVGGETACGGLLLQQLAGAKTPIGDDWRRLGLLADTLRASEVAGGIGNDLLRKLFAEDDLRVFSPRPARFFCRCSRARAQQVLKLLGEAECGSDDDEVVVVTCEYCGSRESFDAVDLAAIFAEDPAPRSDALH